MHLRKLIVLLFLSSLLFSCKYIRRGEALAFNNEMAQISDSLFAKGKAAGYKYGMAIKTHDFSSIGSPSTELLAYIDKQQEKLKKIHDVAGSENLHQAMADLLAEDKNMVETAFVPLEKLNANSTDAEMQTAVMNLLAQAKLEAPYLQKLREAQKEYADRNGFQIKNAPSVQ
ncbi:MAG: hypothetical protein ACTHJ0_02630 [Flavipsychrobacter sp.]